MKKVPSRLEKKWLEPLMLLPLLVLFMLFSALGLVPHKSVFIFSAFHILFLGCICLGFIFITPSLKNRDSSIPIESFLTLMPFLIATITLLAWCGQFINLIFLLLVGIGLMSAKRSNWYVPRIVNNFSALQILSFLVLSSSSLGLYFYITAMPMRPPAEGQIGLYYQDTLWTVGNVWNLINNEPFRDSRVHGYTLIYHLGQAAYHQMCHFFTNIHPFFLQNFLAAGLNLYLICGFSILGSTILIRDNRFVGPVFILLLFFSPITNGYLGGYFGHIFFEQISFFFSLLLLVPFLFLLVSDNDNDYTHQAVYLIVVSLALSTAKATFLAVAPPLVVLKFVLDYLTHKDRKTFFYSLCALSIGTILIKFSMFPSDGARLKYRIIIADYLSSGDYYGLFITNFKVYLGQMHLLFKEYLAHDYLYAFGSVIILLDFFEASYRKKWAYIRKIFYVLLFAFLNLSIISIFDFETNFVYGLWYTRVAMLFLVSLSFGNIRHRVSRIVGAVSLVAILVIGAQHLSDLVAGYEKIAWRAHLKEGAEIWDKGATIDLPEWEAMIWINKHTSPDALILSDRTHFLHEAKQYVLARFFGYSAISGRRFFLEGDDFVYGDFKVVSEARKLEVDKYYKLGGSDLIRYANANKIEYIIQSLRFNSSDLNLQDFLVFENESINIFKTNH